MNRSETEGDAGDWATDKNAFAKTKDNRRADDAIIDRQRNNNNEPFNYS